MILTLNTSVTKFLLKKAFYLWVFKCGGAVRDLNALADHYFGAYLSNAIILKYPKVNVLTCKARIESLQIPAPVYIYPLNRENLRFYNPDFVNTEAVNPADGDFNDIFDCLVADWTANQYPLGLLEGVVGNVCSEVIYDFQIKDSMQGLGGCISPAQDIQDLFNLRYPDDPSHISINLGAV